MGQKHSKGLLEEKANSAKVGKGKKAGKSRGIRTSIEDRNIDAIEEVEIMEDSFDEEDVDQGNDNSNAPRNSKDLDKKNSFHFLMTQSQSSLLFDEPLLDEEIDFDEEGEFGNSEEKNESLSKYSLDDGQEESLPSPLSIKVKEGSGRDSLKESDIGLKGDKQATTKKSLSIEISPDEKGSDVKSPSSPSTLKNLLSSPKYPSEEEDNSKGSDEKPSGDSSVFSSNPLSIIKDGWSKRKLQFRKAAYSAVGPILRPAYLHLSELFIDRVIEENEIKIYVLVTSVDCRKYEFPISREKGHNSGPPWKIRGQIRSESFYLKSGKNVLKERLLLPAVSSDTILVVSLVQTSTLDDSHTSKSKSVHKNTLSEDHEPDFIWAQAFYSIHDVKCTVEKTEFALNLELPTEQKTPEKTSVSPSQSFITTAISPSNATSLRDELPFPFEPYHTDTFDNGRSTKRRTYFPIHLYSAEKKTSDTQTQNLSSKESNAPKLSIYGEIEFVHNSRGSAGKVVVLRDHEIPSENNIEKAKVIPGNPTDSQSKRDSRKSVFNDDYIFDNNVTQDALTSDEIEYEESALNDTRNRYWLVVAKEIYLLKSYLDTNDDLEKKKHQLCDINYVNGPLIGHSTKSILVQIGDEQPWRIVTTNEEEYLHWFQILNALAFESNFLEADDE